MSELLANTIEMIKPLDEDVMVKARARQDTLTKPPGSLGRLEELSIQLAGIQGRPVPHIKEKAIITMAGDHGVVAEKVGNWPQEVTAQMLANFLIGGAGINVIARQVGIRVIVVDMGVATELTPDARLLSRKIDSGTRNMVLGPAMSAEQAVRAIETGIELVADEAARGLDIVGTGDMGIGNTTASAAICAVMTGKTVTEVTGRGSGLTDEQLAHKITVIEFAYYSSTTTAARHMQGKVVLGSVAGKVTAGDMEAGVETGHALGGISDGNMQGTVATAQLQAIIQGGAT